MTQQDTLEVLYRGAQRLRDIAELFDRFVAGKSVLDVGCTNYEGEPRFGLVHGLILQTCARCVGLDLTPAVLRLPPHDKARYFQGNAEEFCLPETFDTIFAGDVIEHLSNPGRFLEQARKMVHASSDLVVVTPNPYSFRSLVGVLRRFEPAIHPEHTMLMPIAGMSELASRHGFRVKQIYLVEDHVRTPGNWPANRAYNRVYHIVLTLPGAWKLADTLAFQLSPQ